MTSRGLRRLAFSAGFVVSLLLAESLAQSSDGARDATRVEGRTVEEWTPQLKSPVSQVRRHACWAFTKFGANGAAARSELIAALDDEDSSVRSSAANALGALGPAAAPAIPRLIEKLDDLQDCLPFTQPIDEVRKHAAAALARIGAASVPALAEALGSKKKTLRIGAALALSEMEPGQAREASKPAVQPLNNLFLRDDVEEKLAASLALVVVDPPAPFAAAFLVVALRSEDPGSVAVACGAFEKLGAVGIAQLEPMLDVTGDIARMLVASSLVDLDPKHAAALQVLEAGARIETPGAAAIALEALGRARGAAAVPSFRAALASRDAEARITAAILLFVHDPGSRAGGALDQAFADPDDEVCRFAIDLFGTRGGAAALPRLEALLASERRAQRVAAAAALLEIDCNHAAATQAMDEALERYVDPARDAEKATKRLTPADEQRLRDLVERFRQAAAKLGVQREKTWSPTTSEKERMSMMIDSAYPELEKAMMAVLKEGPVANAYLAPLLTDADAAVRGEAADLLLDRLPDDPEPLRVMTGSLGDVHRDGEITERLARSKRPGIAEALRAALAGAEPPRRLALAQALLRVDPSAKDALVELFALLVQPDVNLARRAAMTLGDALVKDRSGDVARRLAETLADAATPEEVRTRCAELVAGKLYGKEGEALRAAEPELVAAATAVLERGCREGSPEKRLAAATKLLESDRTAAGALATLVELLGTSAPEVGDRAAFALQDYGEPILLQLVRLVLDPAVPLDARARAAFAIGGMGGIAVSAVRRILKDAPPELRRKVLEFNDHWDDKESSAAGRWRRLGGAAAGLPEPRSTQSELAGILREALKDEDLRVRALAAEKLFDVDRTQKSWAEALDVALAALDAADGATCFVVAGNFDRIAYRTGGPDMEMKFKGSPRERAALHTRLAKELETRIVDGARARPNRAAAAQALASDPTAIARLVQLAASDDAPTVRVVAFGLGYARGYPDPKPAAAKALVPLLDDARAADPWIALNAARSLVQLDSDVEAAKATLQRLTKSTDAQLAATARQTLDRAR
jgi:HEAT repeat protein